MASLWNTKKIAAVKTGCQKEHRMNNSSRNTETSRLNDDLKTQQSGKLENRATEKLLLELRRTKSQRMGTLERRDGFPVSSQVQLQPAETPGTF